MNNRNRRSLILVAFTLAVGLVAGSGVAVAEPVSTPDTEVASVSELPAQPAAPVLLLEDEAPAVPATDYQCVAQCSRDFIDCLNSGCSTEPECQAARVECLSYC